MFCLLHPTCTHWSENLKKRRKKNNKEEEKKINWRTQPSPKSPFAFDFDKRLPFFHLQSLTNNHRDTVIPISHDSFAIHPLTNRSSPVSPFLCRWLSPILPSPLPYSAFLFTDDYCLYRLPLRWWLSPIMFSFSLTSDPQP